MMLALLLNTPLRFFDSTVDTLLKARGSMDLGMLGLAVNATCAAKRVDF